MNIIEKLPKSFHKNDNYYVLNIYPNAWNNLTISYRNFRDKHDYVCSVCIEPKNSIRRIENTIGYLNERIGNAPTFDEGVQLILDYLSLIKDEINY